MTLEKGGSSPKLSTRGMNKESRPPRGAFPPLPSSSRIAMPIRISTENRHKNRHSTVLEFSRKGEEEEGILDTNEKKKKKKKKCKEKFFS